MKFYFDKKKILPIILFGAIDMLYIAAFIVGPPFSNYFYSGGIFRDAWPLFFIASFAVMYLLFRTIYLVCRLGGAVLIVEDGYIKSPYIRNIPITDVSHFSKEHSKRMLSEGVVRLIIYTINKEIFSINTGLARDSDLEEMISALNTSIEGRVN